MTETEFLLAWVTVKVDDMLSRRDGGFGTLEWVALAGIIVVAAITVATVLMQKAKQGAGKINVQ